MELIRKKYKIQHIAMGNCVSDTEAHRRCHKRYVDQIGELAKQTRKLREENSNLAHDLANVSHYHIYYVSQLSRILGDIDVTIDAFLCLMPFVDFHSINLSTKQKYTTIITEIENRVVDRRDHRKGSLLAILGMAKYQLDDVPDLDDEGDNSAQKLGQQNRVTMTPYWQWTHISWKLRAVISMCENLEDNATLYDKIDKEAEIIALDAAILRYPKKEDIGRSCVDLIGSFLP